MSVCHELCCVFVTVTGFPTSHRVVTSVTSPLPCCSAVFEGGGTLLTTPIATPGVWITSSCPTLRTRDPGLHRPPSHALSLTSSCQPRFKGNSCAARDVTKGETTKQRTPRAEGLAKTCRASLHCRPGHRGLKSKTEELGGSELAASGECLSVLR